MIEIKAISKGHSRELTLAIDDVIFTDKVFISESKAELQSDSEGGDSFFEVETLDRKIADIVMAHRFSDLSREIKRIVIYQSSTLIEGETEISQGITIRRGFVGVRGGYVGQTYIAFNFYFDPDNWKRLWSIKEYQKEFRRIFEQQNLPDIRWTPEEARIELIGSIEDRISLSFTVQDADTVIETEARNHSGSLSELHELTVTSLMSKLHNRSVVVSFDFPESIKAPCEQYLLYFVQFLRDLGVEATSDLQHEAEQVLFTITPTDKQQALDKIRAALEVYLNLPSSPISDPEQGEIEVLRLHSQLQHFQSQLSLARAEIQAKEVAIQLQRLTIAQLNGDIIISSLKDKEELLGGTITLVPVVVKGVRINLPEIFRRLKKLFKEGE